MRVTTLPLLLLILAGLVQHSPGDAKVDLGKEFKIKNGKEAVVRDAKLHITIKNVEDSRCPAGVNCVWRGTGAVEIEVALKNKKPVVATLNTSLKPSELVYNGFKIKLVALSPYPKANESIDPKDYVAGFIVTKDE